MGLARLLSNSGLRVAAFKKGPDFIDAAWLGAAVGGVGRNLDTFIMGEESVRRSFLSGSSGADLAVVEGNRGLYDGLDAQGTHSTARLARLLDAPVILVVKATKVTRTVAAMVLGCQTLDPDLRLAGVILNHVGTARQEAVIREAIRSATGLPVVGCIPRLGKQHLPSRHLGLVTAVEHGATGEILDALAGVVEAHVDRQAVLEIAESAPPWGLPFPERRATGPRGSDVVVGVLKDQAFSFYYPENLEALEAAGARLEFLSPLRDTRLPPIDALYAGGGFPEVHAKRLTANEGFRHALNERIGQGIPVWAECGGLMYLSRGVRQDGDLYPMVGALPFEVEQTRRPQGHGYVVARVTSANPFFPPGLELRGHEFHYSRISWPEPEPLLPTALTLSRGTGVGGARDGIVQGRILASYTHIHALGTPEWAPALVRAARAEPPADGPRLP